MQCNTQEGDTTNNLKIKIYFNLPDISATQIVTWDFHMDDSAKGRYGMIFGRDLLT